MSSRKVRIPNEERIRRDWMERMGLTPEQDRFIWDKAKEIIDDMIYAEHQVPPLIALATCAAASAWVAAHTDMQPRKYSDFIVENLGTLLSLSMWEYDHMMIQRERDAMTEQGGNTH